MLAKAVPLVASALVIWKITKGQVSEQADEFWRMMKLDIPLKSIKVGLRLVSPTTVKADLVISNNYTADIEISNLVGTVFAKTPNGLVEIARTPPSSKIFTVKKSSKTTIKQFPIEISLKNGLQNLPAILNRPKGDRLLIKFSGFVQNFPISQEISY